MSRSDKIKLVFAISVIIVCIPGIMGATLERWGPTGVALTVGVTLAAIGFGGFIMIFGKTRIS